MNTTFKSYRDLDVWQRSMRLAKRIYQVTQKFPGDERIWIDESTSSSCGLSAFKSRRAMPVSEQVSSAGSSQLRWAQ